METNIQLIQHEKTESIVLLDIVRTDEPNAMIVRIDKVHLGCVCWVGFSKSFTKVAVIQRLRSDVFQESECFTNLTCIAPIP